jgi:glucose/arabinose dehydrogenase
MLALPSGFVDQIVHSGLAAPIGLELLPNGKMLILEKGGAVRITDPAVGGATPPVWLQLPNVSTDGERGLLDAAYDADFANNGYVYLYYHNSALDKAVVSRFQHHHHHGHAHIEDEVFVWIDTQSISSQQTPNHLGGGLSVGPDGNIYLAIGDKWDDPNDSQDATQSAGSIIRIDPSQVDTLGGWVVGSANEHLIPASNPFIDGVGGNLDEVWAIGLRNPFGMDWDLSTGRLFVSEVGGNIQEGVNASYEDIHVLSLFDGGGNLGWPICEGPNCAGTTPPNYIAPTYSIQHPDARAIMGGPVYRGNAFPAEYRDAFFFADFQEGWIRYLKFDENGEILSSMPVGGFPFADAGTVSNVVKLEEGPDGAIYYVDIFNGLMRRIQFGEGAPVIEMIEGTPDAGLPPLTVSFSASVLDPTNDPLDYLWDFGDGVQSTLFAPQHTYSNSGQYSVVLSVTDGTFTTVSEALTITVGTPPSAVIDFPVANSFFRAGTTIQFQGTGNDESPILNENQQWSVRFIHNLHFHPEVPPTQGYPCGSSSCFDFEIPSTGHDFSDSTGFEITFTVIDAEGLSAQDTVSIYPEKVDVFINTTVPGGTTFSLDGLPRLDPTVIDTAIGFQHTISVPATSFVNGNRYDFVQWSDGTLTNQYVLTVPEVDVSLTAEYSLVGAATLPSSGLVAHYDAGQGVAYDGQGTVLQWNDLSGNNNHLTAVGDPQVIIDGFNGQDYVAFDGTLDHLLLGSGAVGLPTGSSDRSVFLVAKRYRAPGIGGFAYGEANLNETFGLVVKEGFLTVQGWGTANDFQSPTTGNGAGWLVQSAVLNNDVFIHYKDGVAIDLRTHAFQTAANGKIVIGAEIDGARTMRMDVAEVIVYDRALSEIERIETQEYLNRKYFVSNSVPVAVDDAVLTFVDVAKVVDVLANDDLGDTPTTITSVTQGTNGTVTTDGTTTTYTPNPGFVGSDSYTYTITDNDNETSTASVLVDIVATATGPNLAYGTVVATDENWSTVTLPSSYASMVLVTTMNYDAATPAVATRIRNASGNSFEIRLDRLDNQTGATAVPVSYVVVEEGVYTVAEHGVKMEAVRVLSTVTDHDFSWAGQELGSQLSNSYTAPSVLGQVMTSNDPSWSAFWSRGASRTVGVSADSIYVGKHVGQDGSITRADETLGVIVIESGMGVIEGVSYEAAVGSDSIVGVDNAGSSYFLNIADPTFAVATQTGMDGTDGGWAILYGSVPLGSSIRLAIDEDQLFDIERSHITEEVSYLVFGSSNNTPLAVDDVASTTQDIAVTISVLANDDLGDTPTTITSVTQGTNGTVTTDGTTTTYTPNPGFVGSDSYTYTITDNDNETSTASVLVDIVAANNTPLAVDDVASTTQDIAVTISVLANDDLGDMPTTITSVTQGTNGTVTTDGTTTTYTPNPGFVGSDSYTYTITDNDNETSTASVLVDIVAANNTPLAVDDVASTTQDIAVTISVLANDDLGDMPTTITSVTQGTNGTVTTDGTTTTYTPNPGFVGSDSYTYTITDNDNETSTASVLVDIVAANNTPLAVDDVATTTQDIAVTISVLANDDLGDTPTTITSVTQGTNGTVTTDGTTTTYTPNPGFVGSDSYTYTITDNDNETSTASVLVDIVAANNTPLAVDDVASTTQDIAVTISVLANDDLGDTPTTITSVTQGTNGTVTTDGTTTTYTPNPGFVGSDSYTYTITDNDNETSTASVLVDIVATATGPNLAYGTVVATDENWSTVTLPSSYASMVLVTTMNYDAATPAVATRIRNASGNSFEIRLDRLDNQTGATAVPVSYVVVEEGVYTVAEHGVKMEAVRVLSTVTDHDVSWAGQELGSQLSNSYTAPSVLGQVMTSNDPSWSAFWSRGASRTVGVSADSIYVGKHVGQDGSITRADETLGVIVIESGMGVIEGVSYEAAVGSDSIVGVDNAGSSYFLNIADPTFAVATQTGMDGTDGGWAILYGSVPLGSSIRLAIDEDQLFDIERSHITEEVSYLVFGSSNNTPLAVDDVASTTQDIAVTISVLANDDLGDTPTTITSVTQGTNGTVTTDGTTTTYTPNPGFVGSDSYTYTITDNDNETSTASVLVDIVAANNTPLAVDDVASTTQDIAVTISVLANDDLGDMPTTITSVTQGTNGTVTTDGTTTTYTPNPGFVGSDSYTYTITDNDNETSTASVLVDIVAANNTPLAVDDVATTTQDIAVTISVLANDDLGDTPTTITSVTQGTNGTVTTDGTTTTYTPNPGFVGSDSYTYTITDNDNETSTASVLVDIVAANNTPLAVDDVASTTQDIAVTISVLANDDLGDTPTTITSVTQGTNGTVTTDGTTTTYTPNPGFVGSDSYTYTITDNDNETSTASVLVDIVAANNTPLAVDDVATTTQDIAVTISVLANDDLGDTPTTITSVTQGTNGTVTTDGTTTTYTPNPGFVGSDSYTYTITDNDNETSTASVLVDIVAANNTPLAVDDVASTTQDIAVTISVLANDDLGDTPTTITSVTQGTNGTVTTDGTTTTYTPNPGFVGSDSYTYTITDNDNETSTASVLVDIVATATGPNLAYGTVVATDESWSTVTLPSSYASMVLVTTMNYDAATPAVATRIRNASGNSFEIRLDRLDNQTGATAVPVSYVVVEEGVYTVAEHGVKMEAVRVLSTVTDHDVSWAGQELGSQLSNSYTAPSVLGQVMTSNDPSWSAFWSRGASRTVGVSADSIYVGKHVGQDGSITRADETLGVIVIESGMGVIEGVSYEAAVGSDSIVGVDNAGSSYFLNIADPTFAVATQTGMDGTDGGWAILYGSVPLGSSIRLAIDEDQLFDIERSHITEEVSYLVFGSSSASRTLLAVPIEEQPKRNPIEMQSTRWKGSASPYRLLDRLLDRVADRVADRVIENFSQPYVKYNWEAIDEVFDSKFMEDDFMDVKSSLRTPRSHGAWW